MRSTSHEISSRDQLLMRSVYEINSREISSQDELATRSIFIYLPRYVYLPSTSVRSNVCSTVNLGVLVPVLMIMEYHTTGPNI